MKESIISPGILEVNTGIGITDQVLADVPPNLQDSSEKTHRIITEDAISLTKTTDNWLISLKKPSAAYSEPGFLATTAPEDTSLPHTHLIYDAP